jgi:hypothetical protein
MPALPMSRYGIKRPSTKSTLCRGSRLLLARRAITLVSITTWPLYLQQRKVRVRQPWASSGRGQALTSGRRMMG